MSHPLLRHTFSHLRKKFIDKEIRPSEALEVYIKRALETRHLNAFITETFEVARMHAKIADERYAKGEARPLEGLPLGIKDLFCTKGILTTAGSKILKNFVPTYESTVTHKLFQAGALCMGKTNMDEFAMGSSNVTSAFGSVTSPWKKKGDPSPLIPGGSSGGSSASVAVGSSLAALGTDTGGSIRQPASLSGLVGIKPTYGRCSRYGITAFASSLDQAGPLARSVQDAALILEIMAGHDEKDSTSLPHGVPSYHAHLSPCVKNLKIGIPREYDLPGLHPEIKQQWERASRIFKEQGGEIMEISLPHTPYALPVYYSVAPAEASSNLARYDGVRYGLRVEGSTLDEMYEKTRTSGFGEEVTRRILIGTSVLSSDSYEDYYLRAQKVRRKIYDDFVAAFAKVDLILTPTTASEAFKIGENMKDPIAMYLEDIFTVSANLAGIPAISVPVCLSQNGLPLGMQIMGPALGEQKVLNAALCLQDAVSFPLLPLQEAV